MKNFIILTLTTALSVGVGTAAIQKGRLLPEEKPFKLVSAIHKADTQEGAIIISENFEKFTAGSEAAPDTTPLDDEYGQIQGSENYFQTPNWTGAAVYQAGGIAYIGMVDGWYGPEHGFLNTPILDMSANGGISTISFRARSDKSIDDHVSVGIYDPDDPYYPLSVVDLPMTGEWKDYKVALAQGTDLCYVQFYAFEAGLYIDDIVISAEGLQPPTGLKTSLFDGKSAHLSWDASEGADYYLLNVSYLDEMWDIHYPIKDQQVNENFYDITDLNPDYEYSFQVAAVKDGVPSPYSTKLGITYTAAPVPNEVTDYDGKKFTASWSKVESAKSYTVNVYYNDLNEDNTFVQKPVLTDAETTETQLVIDNLPAPTVYYYNVTATETNDSKTKTSESIAVKPASLDAPVALAASDKTDNAFTANWEVHPAANTYKIDVFSNYTAAADETYMHTDTDFNGIVSEGTLEKPEKTYDNEYLGRETGAYGWFVQMKALMNGGVGLDNSFGSYGSLTYMYSPALDLTPFDGKATLTLTLGSAEECTKAIVALATTDEEGSFVEIDTHEVPVTATMTKQTVNLANGTEKCYVLIYPTDGKSLMFDDLQLSIDMKQGTSLCKEIDSKTLYGNQNSSCNFEDINLTGPEIISYKLFAASVNPNKVQITSPYSEEITVNESVSGACKLFDDATKVFVDGNLLRVCNPQNASVGIYSLDGRTVTLDNTAATDAAYKLPARGVYIIKVGARTFKVVF